MNGGARGARSGGERAGEGMGKVEELTRNPFPWSIWVEEDRRSGSTRRGGARVVLPWWLAVGPSIPAGGSSSEARGGAVEVRDTVGEALAKEIDERRPEVAGALAEASSTRFGTSRAGGGKSK